MSKKPKGEVHEVINALEHLSAQSGTRPDVVQNKRDCFQVRATRPERHRGSSVLPLWRCEAASMQPGDTSPSHPTLCCCRDRLP